MIKLISTLIIAGAIVFGMYALWQRQPKSITEEENSSTQSAQLINKEVEKDPLEINPPNNSVLSSNQIEISGKVDPNTKVLIFRDGNQYVATADSAGNFKQEINPQSGLNFHKIVPLDKELKPKEEKIITYYLSQKNVGKKVIAGNVKSTFDNAITIATPDGDEAIRTTKDTVFDIPEDDEEQKATSEVDNIRIGDYIIVTGDTTTANSQTMLSANTLEVVRPTPPKIREKFVVGKIDANPKQNLLQIKNLQDEQITSLKITKTTPTLIGNDEAKTQDIAKDKNAVVFYYSQNQDNIADLVYLLP